MQTQQYLEEERVPFAGDGQYDREYLAGLVVSSGLPAIKLMDQADGRWRALERNPLYLHACYDQARLSLRCAGLTVAPDGGGLRRVLARATARGSARCGWRRARCTHWRGLSANGTARSSPTW